MGAATWKRLQKNGSGERPSAWWHWWGPAAKARSASPSKGAFQSHAFGAAPHGYLLALLDTLLMRTPPDCGRKCCKRMCQLFNLPLFAGSDSWPSALVSLVHQSLLFLSSLQSENQKHIFLDAADTTIHACF